ncbi:MAG: inorganic diphosphatase [archaeon]|nr:MAG: inorganic diphosphatase [archaeon]
MEATNLWHDIKSTGLPDVVMVVVESPMGSRNKMEYDKKYNIMKLDRILYSPVHYPGDYGFIPQTYTEDGDALDAMVLVTEATYPGMLLRARPVALLRMTDQSVYDDKIICVPVNDPRYGKIRDKKDLPSHILEEIEHFFNVYKHLEGKTVKTSGWKGAKEARKVIKHSKNLYERKFS